MLDEGASLSSLVEEGMLDYFSNLCFSVKFSFLLAIVFVNS